MSKLPRFTMITGPRRSGKTHKALRLAKEDGRPFGVLVGSDAPALTAGVYAGAVIAVYGPGALFNAGVEVVIVDDAHLIHRNLWDAILALSADLIIVTAPPSSVTASPWLDVVANAQRINMNPANAELDAEGWARLNKFQQIVSCKDDDTAVQR